MTDSAAPAPISDMIAEVRSSHTYWSSLPEQTTICLHKDKIGALLDYIDRLTEETKEAQKEVEICHARETCMCGDYMKTHSAHSGHSPVSMYDYALDKVTEERDRLRAALAAAGGPVPHLRPAVLPSEEDAAKALFEAEPHRHPNKLTPKWEDQDPLIRKRYYGQARAILALFHSRIGAGSEAAPPAPASRSKE